MKTFFYIILSVLLFMTSLSGRDNPFKASNSYYEEEARLNELGEYSAKKLNENDKEDESSTLNIESKVTSKVDLEDITTGSNINNTSNSYPIAKTNENIKAATFAKKALASMKRKEIDKKNNNETFSQSKDDAVVYVKLRKNKQKLKSLNILPFVKIKYNKNILNINTKYKVKKKFYLEDENKIIIDFYGKVRFFTRINKLDSINFKYITLGNHPKKNFFRVVIVTKDFPSKYKILIKKSLVNISSN